MQLYNSLTRKKEEFIPIEENKVKMYNCGPTVYDFIHIGNARPLVVFDTLRRFFIYQGYEVDFVVNFTDIDDKIINKANKEGLEIGDISERYIEEFKKDADGLNLYDYEIKHPKATEHVEDIIDFVAGLVEKDAAYEVNGNVYFDIDSAEDYGKLSGRNIEDLRSGSRVEINEEKNNPMDFVLWKAAKKDEPAWDSPWGKGRPGWHIECSAMSRSLLGETIDIHSGGEDLQFPHHENEIAQSETLSGETFANYWLHNGMLTVDNKKMSKSVGNFFTLREISEDYDLEVVRFFLLSSHYRSPMNFSREIMEQSKNGLDRLYNAKKNYEHLIESKKNKQLDEAQKLIDQEIINYADRFKEDFMQAMANDLNTADAISSLFDLVRFSNTHIEENTGYQVVEHIQKLFSELTDILGILKLEEGMLEEDILKLIDERTEARKNKDYAKSDEIRDELLADGIVLEDTPDGVKWKRV